jgi:predicted RNase H-like HicB family nuclease
MEYEVELERDEDGYYIVSCPIFKSCHSSGATIEEARENIKEVIDMCLDEIEIEGLKEILNPKYAHIKLQNSRTININLLQLA